MKKIVSNRRFVLLVCLLCLAGLGMAQTLINGIYYNLDSGSGTAEVTSVPSGVSNYSGSISIPENVIYGGKTYTVTSIGEYAFCNSGLRSITIPNSVTSIGNDAFYNCSSLTSIKIPNSVTSIGRIAFGDCGDLRSITIPNSVTSIGVGLFFRCTNLTSIVVDAGNRHYDSRNNCNAIIETASNTLIVGCKNTVIPNSVTSIGEGAFMGSYFSSITIPNSVTSIEANAFFYSPWLRYIKMMSSTPPTTGGGVFDYCSGLTTVYVPQGAAAAYNVAPWSSYEIKELVFSEGYYYISDSRSPKYYIYNDNAEAAKAKFLLCDETTPNEIPTVEDAKYIWHVTAGETAGQWYFENFKTGKRACNTTEETGVTAFTVNSEGDAFKVEDSPYYGVNTFIIMRATDDAQWNTAVHQGKYICKYNVKNDLGNNFQFYKIDAARIAAIEEAVKQNVLNQELEALYNTAYVTYASSRKFTGAPTGQRFGDQSSNLVYRTDQLYSNAVATNEPGASLAGLLDGDFGTYFHTAWAAADGPQPPTWHYLQADLEEEVSALALKYAQRVTHPKCCAPTTVQILSTNNPAGGKWTDNGTVTFTYTIDGTYNGADKTNLIGTCGFELAEPARYVRLVVKDRLNGTGGELLDGYPFWYLSELHFYKGTYDATTSPFELVPAEVREALAAQLANAKDELLTSKATQATFDALKAAYEAFLALLPDSKVAAAQALHDAAPVAEEPTPGYFPEEAKVAYQAAINTASAAISGDVTVSQINAALAALEAATATFKASLYLPAVGSYCLIRSMSETNSQALVYANSTATTDAIRFRSQVAESEAEDASKVDAVDWTVYPNYVWYVEAAANGKVTLRNVLTGRYFAFQDTKGGGVQQSVTPVEVPVQSALIGGIVNFVVGEGLYANTDGGGQIVAWDSANGADNSAFGFEQVEPGRLNVYGDFKWGVQGGIPQVITLPVAVGYCVGGTAYRLLGENADNELVFKETGEVEAGVPFLFIADAGLANDEATFTLASGSFGNAPSYAAKAQDQNGMQGTFEDITVEVGYGVLWRQSLKIITPTSPDYLKNLSANSGYFNGNHQKNVTAQGDYKIRFEGVLTSIAAAPIAAPCPASAPIYDLNGRRVGTADAMDTLPKGVYIVNGKKVVR